MTWSPPGARDREAMLTGSQTVAIVGASSNPARSSNFVITYLLSSSADFDVYLVNPRESEILGQQVYRMDGDVRRLLNAPRSAHKVLRPRLLLLNRRGHPQAGGR